MTEVGPRSLVAADGIERPVDVIVAATGFRPSDPTAARRLRGRDGRTLAEHWHGCPQAHRGTTIAGFPNFFMMLGPHTGLGHTSVLLMIESQIEYLLAALAAMEAAGVEVIEPRGRGTVGVRRGSAPARARHRLGERRVRKLVPGRRRAFDPLAGLRLAVSPDLAPLRPRELPRSPVHSSSPR